MKDIQTYVGRAGLAAFGLLVLDQVSKLFVERSGDVFEIGPLTIGAIVNRAGVLGLPLSNALLIVLGFVICGFLLWRLMQTTNQLLRTGLWLLLTGAFSNTLDRLFYGGVVDVMAVGPSAHFNVADMLILVGAGLIIMVFWQKEWRG